VASYFSHDGCLQGSEFNLCGKKTEFVMLIRDCAECFKLSDEYMPDRRQMSDDDTSSEVNGCVLFIHCDL
jgi:hypothetical protein